MEEVWVRRGSPQAWGHPAWKVLLGVYPLGGCQHPTIDLEGWVTLGQKNTKEGAKSHPPADNWIKALLSKALHTIARPSFSTTNPSPEEAYTSLLASSIRSQIEARRTTVPQRIKQKTTLQKLNHHEKAESYVTNEGTI